jgi:hypothetical protein
LYVNNHPVLFLFSCRSKIWFRKSEIDAEVVEKVLSGKLNLYFWRFLCKRFMFVNWHVLPGLGQDSTWYGFTVWFSLFSSSDFTTTAPPLICWLDVGGQERMQRRSWSLAPVQLKTCMV